MIHLFLIFQEPITTDSIDIKRILKDYEEQLYANKFDNLNEKDQFLQRHNLPKLAQEEIDHLN